MSYLPKDVEKFSTSDAPTSLGTTFACDIMRRNRQHILLVRDAFSSYTTTRLIADETRNTIRSALLETTVELASPSGCTIRVDCAPAFQGLTHDASLMQHGIKLDVGRTKNKNKNPVAEKGIQELERELKRAYPDGSSVTSAQLALVTATLNSRIRNRGLSAKEIVYQRDNRTGQQLNFADSALAESQHNSRLANHLPSALSQSRSNHPPRTYDVKTGDLVYLKNEGDKHTARDTYMSSSPSSRSS